jgi:tagatose-6-phosphate ketose/aldose isomerase
LSDYLGISESELNSRGAIYTAREIAGQPDLWLKTWQFLREQTEETDEFLAPLLRDDSLEIILTGAGTSAFIGEVLSGHLQNILNKPVRAIATTDIVTHPENCFHPHRNILLISFARSGNSPESVAAVNLAEQLCQNIYHLIITCNKDGKIVRNTRDENSYVFLLPPEANDMSLAMTGSFTSMALAGLFIWPGRDKVLVEKQIQALHSFGSRILGEYIPSLKQVAESDFKRAVFLGSGPLYGTAHESHLKLQELSDGRVICKYDSFLGFRHGPKAVIDKSTLIVFLFSTDPYVYSDWGLWKARLPVLIWICHWNTVAEAVICQSRFILCVV